MVRVTGQFHKELLHINKSKSYLKSCRTTKITKVNFEDILEMSKYEILADI